MAKRKGKKRAPKKRPARKRAPKRKVTRRKGGKPRSRSGHQDLQSKAIEGGFYLSRVGIKGVRKPVQVRRPKGLVTLTPTIDIFVDLPARQKGSHMSRNTEVVAEIIDRSVRTPSPSLECLCGEIARELLEKHSYANNSEVHMTADYFLEKGFAGKTSLEAYTLMASASAVRGVAGGVEVEKLIGVEVIGMTACPCAMDTVRAILEEEEGFVVPDDVPVFTHNQRNVARVLIQVPEKYEVEADELIEMVEASFSSSTFEILKRSGEGRLVMKAHYNPKFVEDVVRDILLSLVENFRDLPDDVKVMVSSEAEESIHKHDAYAERETTLGELRK